MDNADLKVLWVMDADHRAGVSGIMLAPICHFVTNIQSTFPGCKRFTEENNQGIDFHLNIAARFWLQPHGLPSVAIFTGQGQYVLGSAGQIWHAAAFIPHHGVGRK